MQKEDYHKYNPNMDYSDKAKQELQTVLKLNSEVNCNIGETKRVPHINPCDPDGLRWYRITDDSMRAPQGFYVDVDWEIGVNQKRITPKDGDYCLAQLIETGKLVFRKYRKLEKTSQFLEAINPEYPILDHEFKVVGTIEQAGVEMDVCDRERRAQ